MFVLSNFSNFSEIDNVEFDGKMFIIFVSKYINIILFDFILRFYYYCLKYYVYINK